MPGNQVCLLAGVRNVSTVSVEGLPGSWRCLWTPQGRQGRAGPESQGPSHCSSQEQSSPGALGQQQQPWASGTSLGMGMGRGQANSPQVGIRIKHGEGVCMKHLFLLLFQSFTLCEGKGPGSPCRLWGERQSSEAASSRAQEKM